MATIHVGILRAFDIDTFTARVTLTGSLHMSLASLPVSRAIAPGEMMAGRLVTVIIQDETKASDAAVIGVYHGSDPVAAAPLVARVRRDSAQTIEHDTGGFGELLEFDTVQFDTGGFFDAGEPTRLTAPQDGYYLIVGSAVWDDGTPGTRRLRIYKNGVAQATLGVWPVESSGVASQFMVSDILQLDGSDYVALGAYQVSGGGDLDVLKVGDTPALSAALLR